MYNNRLIHYLSPKLEVRPRPEIDGYGVYARQFVSAGELLTIWGGQIVSRTELEQLSPIDQHHAIQIEDEFYLAPIGEAEPADYFNHSCDPNAGLSGQIALVALQDIQSEEEVCFDYAMSDSSSYDEFDCKCGSTDCRGKIRGNDWMLPELWDLYDGYFSPYLHRRIVRLRFERTISIPLNEPSRRET